MDSGSIADWAQVILTVIAGLVAWWAFREQRDATRLTQRADVLVTHATIRPVQPLRPSTTITIEFKNFGPTRASNLKIGSWLEYAEIRSAIDCPMVVTTLGAGDNQPAVFPPIGQAMNKETADAIEGGSTTFKFVTVATYDDVFGKLHRTRNEGIYRPRDGTFELTSHESD